MRDAPVVGLPTIELRMPEVFVFYAVTSTQKLELRTPFAYLKDLTSEIRKVNQREEIRLQTKNGRDINISAVSQPIRSNWLQSSGGDRIRTCDPAYDQITA